MINTKDLKVGTIVYFREEWSGSICRGPITELLRAGTDGVIAVRIDSIEGTIGNIGALIDDIFYTKEDCIEEHKRRDEKIVEKYVKSIHTVEDLIQFMYSKPLNAEEYTDYEARKAVRIKAKELLNLDLEV